MEITVNIISEPTRIYKDKLVHRSNKGHSGVYVMYDLNNVCLYVGKTSSLGNRMVSHRNTSDFYREVEYINFYPNSNEYEKDILETYLINEFKPLHNKAKTFYLQEDYSDMLAEINEEINELQSEISYREYYLYTPKDEQYKETPEMNEEAFLDDYDRDILSFEEREEYEELVFLRRRLDKLYERKQHISLRKSL